MIKTYAAQEWARKQLTSRYRCPLQLLLYNLTRHSTPCGVIQQVRQLYHHLRSTLYSILVHSRQFTQNDLEQHTQLGDLVLGVQRETVLAALVAGLQRNMVWEANEFEFALRILVQFYRYNHTKPLNKWQDLLSKSIACRGFISRYCCASTTRLVLVMEHSTLTEMKDSSVISLL